MDLVGDGVEIDQPIRYRGFLTMPKGRNGLGEVLFGNWIGSPRLIDVGMPAWREVYQNRMSADLRHP